MNPIVGQSIVWRVIHALIAPRSPGNYRKNPVKLNESRSSKPKLFSGPGILSLQINSPSH